MKMKKGKEGRVLRCYWQITGRKEEGVKKNALN